VILENLRPNLKKANLGKSLAIYYSYETPIAFRYKGNLVVSESIWTKSTAMHLNYIDPDKAFRIDNRSMMEELRLILKKLEV
jgi:hypothetical protein